jgi:hypothetical protein
LNDKTISGQMTLWRCHTGGSFEDVEKSRALAQNYFLFHAACASQLIDLAPFQAQSNGVKLEPQFHRDKTSPITSQAPVNPAANFSGPRFFNTRSRPVPSMLLCSPISKKTTGRVPG